MLIGKKMKHLRSYFACIMIFSLATAFLAACSGVAPPLVSISIAPSTADVGVGATQQLMATATYADGTTRDVTNIANWSSSASANAVVASNSGLVKALSVGSSEIKATFGSVSGQATVNVSPVVTTVAGSLVAGNVDGPGNTASFSRPVGLVLDSAGNLFVSDFGNNSIRKITPDGAVTTFAGNPTAGSADGVGSAAGFNGPYGLAIDATDNLYVADSGNCTIRLITPAALVSTIAGKSPCYVINNYFAYPNSPYLGPTAVAVDASGTLYVGDQGTITKLTSAGVFSDLLGINCGGSGDLHCDDNPSLATYGLALDISGNLYFSQWGCPRDDYNFAVGVISSGGSATSLIAGPGLGSPCAGSGATFNYPGGIALDASGNIYVADTGDNEIKEVTPVGVVSVVAGSTTAGHGDGPLAVASFAQPIAVAFSGGSMYIADGGNYEIRRIIFSIASGQ
jgi:serine/threonine protein kinase, bacterial